MRRLHFIIAVALTFVVLHAGQAIAQPTSGEQVISLAVHPAVLEISGVPGTSQQASVSIKNTSTGPLPLSLKSSSLLPIETVLDQSRRDEFDASSWISIDSDSLLLDQSESQEINFEITVPMTAQPGGHYAQIDIRALRDISQATDQTGAVVQPEVSIALLITVPGDFSESATLNTDSLISSFVIQDSMQTLAFTIQNTGDVHMLPAPRITITGPKDYSQVFALQPQLILPNTEKEFTLDWLPNVAMGTYNVSTELVYGTESIPLAHTGTSFKVVPKLWKIALFSALAISVAVAFRVHKNVPDAVKTLKDDKIPTPVIPATKPTLDESEASAPQSSENTAVISDPTSVTKVDDRDKQTERVVIQTSASIIIQDKPTAPEKPATKKKAIVTSKNTARSKSKTTKIKVTIASEKPAKRATKKKAGTKDSASRKPAANKKTPSKRKSATKKSTKATKTMTKAPSKKPASK